MRKIYFFLICVSSIIALSSCASKKIKQEAYNTEYLKKVTKLEQQLTDLKTQNAILKTRASKTGPTQARDPALIPIPASVDGKVNGEHSLYSALLESYWKKDVAKVKRLTQMLIKTYPKSVHADNALYLLGSLESESGQIADALQTFNKLVKEYPYSNKVASAELAKANIYSRLNLSDLAHDLYRKVAKAYPGSVEARQAMLQLKVMAQNAPVGTKK